MWRPPGLLLALVLASCANARHASTPAPTAPTQGGSECGAPAARVGGAFLETADGARVWFRDAGPRDAPALVFLHGGPGYNSIDFERSVLPLLERSLRVVVLDQRGCGRSSGGQDAALGMTPTIADLERIRARLGIARWSVVGHSFGGMVALAYQARHPERVARLLLVETSADMQAALEHQVQAAAAMANERFPEHATAIASIAGEGAPPLDRLMKLYGVVGRVPLQRALHWASADAQTRADGWDEEAGLLACTRPEVLPSYRGEAWLARRGELLTPRSCPVLLIAGRQSEVIGARLIEATAEAWGVQPVWMEHSGHFPFVEEPDRFAQLTVAFVSSD
jgi:proline iminopeptidase